MLFFCFSWKQFRVSLIPSAVSSTFQLLVGSGFLLWVVFGVLFCFKLSVVAKSSRFSREVPLIQAVLKERNPVLFQAGNLNIK